MGRDVHLVASVMCVGSPSLPFPAPALLRGPAASATGGGAAPARPAGLTTERLKFGCLGVAYCWSCW